MKVFSVNKMSRGCPARVNLWFPIFFTLICLVVPLAAAASDIDVALIKAAQEGDVEEVTVLISKGANVNAKYVVNYWTALFLASQNAHTQVVKVLLDSGADVNCKTSDGGWTPLIVASQNGHTAVVNLLLEKGADVRAKASFGKRGIAVVEVGEDGKPISKPEHVFVTALDQAKKNAHRDIVVILEKAMGASEKRRTATLYSKEIVRKLQKKLKDLGYDPGPIDGIWGKKTASALEHFQRSVGLPVTGKADEKTKEKLGLSKVNSKTIEKPSATREVGKLFNDYLIYMINSLPQQMAPPEARHALKQTAEPIAQQYEVPLSPAMEKPYVHFPRETCRGVFDQETRLMVPEFLDKWVDLMGVTTITKRGNFPQILFKGFRVTLVKDGDRYRVGFPDGARAKIGNKSYTYATATGKWLESKE